MLLTCFYQLCLESSLLFKLQMPHYIYVNSWIVFIMPMIFIFFLNFDGKFLSLVYVFGAQIF